MHRLDAAAEAGSGVTTIEQAPGAAHLGREQGSVAVVGGLEGTGLGDIDVGGLVVGEDGELGAQLGQVKRGHLLVQVLGQHVHLVLIAARLALVPQLQLRNHLMHHIATIRMSCHNSFLVIHALVKVQKLMRHIAYLECAPGNRQTATMCLRRLLPSCQQSQRLGYRKKACWQHSRETAWCSDDNGG